MNYISTRGAGIGERHTFSDILLGGLAKDGGLYLPSEYPRVSADELARWRALPYADLAFEILAKFCDDIPADDLRAITRRTIRPTSIVTRATAATRPTSRRSRRSVPRTARRSRCSNCRTARRSRSRTWRCSCSATCSSTRSPRTAKR